MIYFKDIIKNMCEIPSFQFSIGFLVGYLITKLSFVSEKKDHK